MANNFERPEDFELESAISYTIMDDLLCSVVFYLSTES